MAQGDALGALRPLVTLFNTSAAASSYCSHVCFACKLAATVAAIDDMATFRRRFSSRLPAVVRTAYASDVVHLQVTAAFRRVCRVFGRRRFPVTLHLAFPSACVAFAGLPLLVLRETALFRLVVRLHS